MPEELRLAQEEHRFSIRKSAITARAYEVTVSTGVQRLALYYKGGIKPELIAQIIHAAATVAIPPQFYPDRMRLMRKLIVILLSCGLLALPGCGEDKDAQAYAEKLALVLKAYREQVNIKSKAEQESYKHLAAVYARTRQEDIIMSLEIERSERTDRMTDALLKRKDEPVSPSEVLQSLLDYADFDFNQTRELLEREGEAYVEYIANLENLSLETKKIETLIEALNELAKPKGRAQRLKDFAAFAEQVETNLDKLTCEDIAKKIKCLEKKKEQADEQKKKKDIDNEIKQLKQQSEGKGCPDMPDAKCP